MTGDKKLIRLCGLLAAFYFCLYLKPACQAEDKVQERVRLGVWGLGEGEWMKGRLAAMTEFERRYNSESKGDKKIELVASVQGGRMNPQKLMCAIAGEAPPDVINQDRFSISGWAARDAFIPLNEFIEGDKDDKYAIRSEDYYVACWSEAVYKGKVYAIPNSTDDRALYYNKDILKASGYVDSNGEARPPKNWDELKSYAVKLSKKSERGELERVGFIPNFGNSWLYMYGWQNGGEFMSADGLTCTLNHPKIVEALEWMASVYDLLGGRSKVDAFTSTFQPGALDPFINGKVAMKVDGNWWLGGIARYKPDLNFGVVAAPVPQGQPITWSGGFSWAIPKGAKNPQLAWEFIKWMSSSEAELMMNEVQQRYNKSRGRPFTPGISANMRTNELIWQKFAVENPDLNDDMRKYLRLFVDLMPKSRFRPVTPVGQLLWDEHVRAFERATFHEYEPKKALNIGAESVQKELDRIFQKKVYPKMKWSYPIWAGIALAAAGLSFMLLKVIKAKDKIKNRIFIKESLAGYSFASPWIAGFLLLTAGPILASVILSFCEYDVLHDAKFVGFDNYKYIFTKDPQFWKSLWNTTFMVAGVPLGMALGLGIAMLLNAKVRGMTLYRTIFYLPAIVPVVASSVLWIWVFNPQSGLINSFLKFVSLKEPLDAFLKSMGFDGLLWLQDKHLAKPSIILMSLWGAGAGMIIWLAGLKGIPEHLYEAAKIDGANAWKRFSHITLPMLTPYIFFNLIMGIIGAFQIFTQAYIMTQGGPVDATLFYVYYLFNNAFQYFKMGYASALAWILFAIILTLTLIQLRLAPRWVHYEAEK